MAQGFRFVVVDVNCTEGDRVIELDAPEALYDIAGKRTGITGQLAALEPRLRVRAA